MVSLFTSCHEYKVTVRFQNNKLKLGYVTGPVCLKHLFISRDNNKVTVRFQNNNKLKLGLARCQGFCHFLFTSRDCMGVGRGEGLVSK